MPNKSSSWIFLFSVIIIVFFEIFFRLRGIPVITGDSVWFYAIAENFSQHRGLFHPFMSPIENGGGPLIWHGWIHPYITGLLGRLFVDPFLGVTISETILVGLGCITFTWTVVSTENSSSFLVKASVVISVVAMAFGSLGRPESIAFVFLVAGIAALQYIEQRSIRLGSIAVLWGGIGATQPTVALLIGPALLGYLIASDSSPRSALIKWVVIGATSVSITFLLTIVFYPYSLVEWIEGLWLHSQKIADRGDSGRLLYYFMLQPSRFMQGGWFVLATICGALLLWQSGKLRDWWLLGVAVIGIGLGWYTSIRVPPTRYNLFALLPLFVLFIYYCIDNIRGRKLLFILKSYVLVMGVFSVLILGRRYMVFGRSLLSSDRSDVIERIEELPDRSEIHVEKRLLFSIYEPGEWHDFRVLNSKVTDKCSGKYSVVKQSGLGSLKPPNIEGYKLLEDRFNSKPIYFGPLRIANTDDSYNFAVYEKLE